MQVSNLKPCVCPNEAIRIGGEALLTWIQVVGFIVSGKVSQRGNSISLLELVDIIHVCHQIRKRALHFYSKLVCPLLSIVQAMSDFACFITAAKLMQMVGEIVLNSQKCLNPVVATNDTNMLMLAKLKCVALLLVKPIRVRNESDIDKQVCAIRNSLLLIKDGYSAENSHHFSVMLYTLRRLLTQISTDLDSFKHEAYFEEGIETLAGIMIDSNNIVVAELLVHKYKWLSKEGKFTRLQQTYWRSSIYNSHKISSYQAKDLELDRTKENTMQCMAAAMTEATTSLLYSDSVTWDDQYKDLQLFILQVLL